MAREEVKVIIDEDGKVEVSVKGVPGKGCMEATKDLEKALGATVGRKKTNEYHQGGRAKQKIGG